MRPPTTFVRVGLRLMLAGQCVSLWLLFQSTGIPGGAWGATAVLVATLVIELRLLAESERQAVARVAPSRAERAVLEACAALPILESDRRRFEGRPLGALIEAELRRRDTVMGLPWFDD